jgi:transcriptional regulator with XRE-family HTH domain
LIQSGKKNTGHLVPHSVLRTVFGKNVKVARTGAGLTQGALAERVGVSRYYLAQIEAGRANPSLDIIAALAWALGTQPADLLTGPVQRKR